MTLCAHCDEPIRRDELSRRINRHGATGGGSVDYVHVRPCRPPSPRVSMVGRRMAALIQGSR